MLSSSFNTIQEAIEDLKQGKFILLVDDENRENEGDLVCAAELATAETINFMTQYARGLVCMPLSAERFDELGIPMMVKENRCYYQTAFGVSIGAAKGITTGISCADRALTVRVAADPKSSPEDIVMPGHIFPLRAEPNGVLVRTGHTEGAIDLMRLANLNPAAVICEVMDADGSMARLPSLLEFAKNHGIKIISIYDLVTYRVQRETMISEVSMSQLPVRDRGNFSIHTFESHIDHTQHVALVSDKIKLDAPPLIRLHSECLTGDVFGSGRCDCGRQLDQALARIDKEGGALLYLRQEGRGIGLANKIKAYALQDQGLDTVEANHQLGFGDDQRDYGIAAQILRSLGIHEIRLLTNNPRKVAGLERYGIRVIERVSHETLATDDNIRYLQTKREKLGHLLSV